MSTGALKYETGHDKGNTGTKTAKKLFRTGTAAAAALSAEEREILKAALEAQDEWVETNNNFDYVHDELLVDYYTYRIKACEARYTYFLKLVKEKGLARYFQR